MSEPFQNICLSNGLHLRCYDLSNRYFGDFHQVRVKLTADIPLDRMTIPADLLQQRSSLPEILHFEKQLQRMGVKGADLEQVRGALVRDFLATAVPYLESPHFPEQLLRKQMTEKLKRSNSSPGWD
jgi:hypothetical protein